VTSLLTDIRTRNVAEHATGVKAELCKRAESGKSTPIKDCDALGIKRWACKLQTQDMGVRIALSEEEFSIFYICGLACLGVVCLRSVISFSKDGVGIALTTSALKLHSIKHSIEHSTEHSTRTI